MKQGSQGVRSSSSPLADMTREAANAFWFLLKLVFLQKMANVLGEINEI